jgi:DNA ligase D-like protein (predicted ligase)
VVDGEVVAFEDRTTSFARLQQRMQIDDPERARSSGIKVHYYLFDLIHLEAHDLRQLPLRRRKALLRDALAFEGPLRFTPHRNAAGEALFREACSKGWEGLIAKRANASYQGRRTSDWLKLKCSQGQELVIGGFSAARGSRLGFGALLLGYYEGAGFHYAGKVGTGFDDRTLVDLRRRLDRLARPGSPFAEDVGEAAVTFVQPKLVAEIGFTEWTADGRLRHPRFLGLRRDKPPEEVGRERTGP